MQLHCFAAAFFGGACWGQSASPGASGPAANASGSPFGGTGLLDSGPAKAGLLPARRATGDGSWLTPATPARGAEYAAAQSSSVITPEPFTPQPYDAVYLEGLESPAPPEVRVAGLAEDTVAPLNQMAPEPQGQLPPGARDGVFQKIYFTGSWIPRLEDEPDTLGLGELDTGVVLGFPFMRRDTPLLVTPQFGVHFLENAAAVDLPSTLYDAGVDFRHMRKFGGGPWAMDVSTTVGYYSDYERSSSDAVRVSGRGIGVYESSPTTKWLLGVAYLNRAGASVLPVFGVIFEPTATSRFEAIFPRPRFLWQTPGSQPGGDERWLYVGGEFGGGVWSITRPSTGELDVLNYSDWRLLAGFERKIIGGLSTRFETGYVFKREVEFDSATPDVTLDDTVFLRAGVTY